MYKSGANSVYVNTWRVYPGTYPYNGSDNLMSVTASVWLYGTDINGNAFALDSSRKDSEELQLNVSSVYSAGQTNGRNTVINNATGGIAYDGDNYIWSWAVYNNTTFATASKTITLPYPSRVGKEVDEYGSETGLYWVQMSNGAVYDNLQLN